MQLGGVYIHGYSKHDGSVPTFRNVSASSAKVKTTIYQNGATPLFVCIIGYNTAGGTTELRSDAATPPTTVVANLATASAFIPLIAIILPYHYYSVVEVGSAWNKGLWTEWS